MTTTKSNSECSPDSVRSISDLLEENIPNWFKQTHQTEDHHNEIDCLNKANDVLRNLHDEVTINSGRKRSSL